MTKQSILFRPAIAADQSAIQHLALATGLFGTDDIDQFNSSVREYFDTQDGDDFWIIGEQSGAQIAAAYCGPEGFADRVFNLYFIAVEPKLQGQHTGSQLLSQVEDKAKSLSARILILETSGLGSFAATRAFYSKHGYSEEARIRDYYGPGDNKVIFWKTLG